MAGRSRRHIFERLDQNYIDDLVIRAGQGSSNAFAELFASSADRQLYYLTELLGSRVAAASAVRDVFTDILADLPSMSEPGLFMLQLSRHSSNLYLEKEDHQEAGDVILSQYLNLPLAESQVLIMTDYQGLTEREAAEILNVSTKTIRRFIRIGRKHLGREAGSGAAYMRDDVYKMSKHDNMPSSDAAEAYQPFTLTESAMMLEEIYDRTGIEPGSLPMESLTSYAVYRRERFSLQRGILTVALILFMLLPCLFIAPSYSVDVEETGPRGLPVYTISVGPAFPVRRVSASVSSHKLPVYEAASRVYRVEPTRNGVLNIEVELANRQKVSGGHDVTAVDSEGPVFVSSDVREDSFTIFAEDEGIGIDYREIYAVTASGSLIYPSEAGEDGIVFDYPEERWDIYIPDHIGNTLHLAVTLHQDGSQY